MNLGQGNENEIKVYEISVSNSLIDGELKMQGTSITAEYTTLMTIINSEELAENKLAVAADFEIIDVTNDVSTISIKVLYEKLSLGVLTLSWVNGGLLVNDEIETIIPDISDDCAIWHPETILYSWVLLDPIWICTQNGNTCLSTAIGDPHVTYDEMWINQDANNAVLIAEEYVQSLNYAPNGTALNLPWTLVDVDVRGWSFIDFTEWENSENHIIINIIVASQVGYCY